MNCQPSPVKATVPVSVANAPGATPHPSHRVDQSGRANIGLLLAGMAALWLLLGLGFLAPLIEVGKSCLAALLSGDPQVSAAVMAKVQQATFLIALPVALVATAAGTMVAIVIESLSNPARKALLFLCFFPLGVHISYRVFGVEFLLTGTANLGPLLDASRLLFTRWATIAGLAHWVFPVAVMVMVTALSKLPKTQFEAARLLGAPKRSLIWRLTIPQLLPAMLLTFGLIFCLAYGSYITPEALGGIDDFTTSRLVGELLRQGRLQGAALAGFVALAVPLVVFALVGLVALKLQQSPQGN